MASKYRQKVIHILKEKPKTPTEISTETRINLTHISRALQELVKVKIVICLTPKRVKGKIYKLTEEGKKIAKLLKSK